MNFELKLGLHSSEKDHCVMTGGTLKVDKEVHFEGRAQVYTFALELFPNALGDTDFHKGMHTNEHLLAYSKETGSVRASIEEIDPNFNGKWILDVSPYRFPNGSFGVRVTSLQDISNEVLQQTFALSIKKAIVYTQEMLEGRGDSEGFMGVPFAKAAQCGQYNFHNPKAAQEALENIPEAQNIKIIRNTIQDNAPKLLVCDLRMLKPKLENRDDMLMFDPWVSYTLSEIIEQKLPRLLGRSAVIVGTFGCMTGMYLCVSAERGDEDEISTIHASIMRIVGEIDTSSWTEAQKAQIARVSELYIHHNSSSQK